jgi:hypothetical protein
MKGRLAVLILLLATALTLASANHEVSKVEKYAESVEFAVDAVQSQLNFEANLRVKYVNELLKQIDGLRTTLQRERSKMNALLGIDGKYDNNNVLVNAANLDKFIDYKVNVASAVLFNIKTSEGDFSFLPPPVEAPAIIIGKYALMASHTSDSKMVREDLLSRISPSGGISDVEIVKHAVFLIIGDKPIEMKEIYRDRENDFTLFELPEGITAQNFPFLLGNSDELRIGNFIYMNGKPLGGYEVARPGHVTTLSVLYDGDGYKKDENKFGISQVVQPGDSGSPIVIFRDGKPELVGICVGYIGSGGNVIRSNASKINTAIDGIKEKLGIDLRRIQKKALSK